ncbi:hypothetical protein GCM10025868_40330 [Angustibacter aerolatus]|uniref:Uncharacterized protein n=1 Tax=Angustibacter aerolatus TaxID=1162965 RepID=A0ABQ6JKP2_9ACTN|nr:hypothetical protein GCM10025868_40330 [Angustibacter aerolatus]
MRRPGGLGAQRVSLLDAEPVLLVDDHEAEVGELHVLLQQGVRADHDARLAGRRLQQAPASDGGGLGAGEQPDAGADVAAAEHARFGQVAEHRGDRAVVLHGEHLGGGQQRGLPAGVDDREHRAQRHERLARPDLALQEPVHRSALRQVGGHLLAHLALAGRRLERQPRVEGVEQPSRPGHARGRRQRGVRQPAAQQRGLQHERLLVAQPVPRDVRLLEVCGRVHPLQRRAQVEQPAARTDVGRQRVGQHGQGLDDRAERRRPATTGCRPPRGR